MAFENPITAGTPKIQDGGDLPSWKSWNGNISTKNYPISMKLGTADLEFGDSHTTKYEIFKF